MATKQPIPNAKTHLTAEALLKHPALFGELPDMPIAIAGAEFRTLARLGKSYQEELAAVGLEPDTWRLLKIYARGLDRFEGEWQRARADGSNAQRKKLRREAETLKRHLLCAGEFACRADAKALKELAHIREGAGISDTLQDLHDLRRFWEARLELLKKTRMRKRHLKRTVTLAEELLEAVDAESENDEAEGVRELRNRCFWLASDLADEIRHAGRYAFEDEPDLAKKFPSRYRQRQTVRRRRRSKLRKLSR